MTLTIRRTVKKLVSLIAVAAIAIGIAITAETTASAVSTTAFSQVSSSKKVKVYTISTGNTIPYTSSSLITRGTKGRASITAYIAATDELYVYEVTETYAYVSYPVGNTRYKAYIPTSAITSNNGDHAKTISTGKFSTYTRSDGTGGSSTMYVASGDEVFRLATSGSYTQIMYPVSNNTAWRMAWCKTTDYNKYCTPATFDPVWPCKEARYITTLYRLWNAGNPLNHSTRSNMYNAIDISGTSGDTIYAIESGTIVEKGYQSGGFGNYLIIEHSSTGLFSLYAHLESASKYDEGESVSKGQAIGNMGKTGNSTGTHLHFEVYDPTDYNRVINPWTTYYQGKVSVTVGSNSYRVNSRYTSDDYAKAWCNWLTTECKVNSSGDYIFTT